MKNVFFASGIFIAGLLVTPVEADVFMGNGGTGFDDVLGNSTLEVTASGSAVNSTLTTGPGDLNDFVVIYIDSIVGGATNTAAFVDTGAPGIDLNRSAISGFGGGNRSIVNFAPGFEADFAISFDSGFGGLWQLDNNSSFTFVGSVNLSPTGNSSATDFDFDFDFSQIGITSADSFDFVATYLNARNAFRSNEAIGASDAPSDRINVANGALTFTGFETFNPVAIPEPTSVALMFGICLFGASRRRR